MRQLRLGAGGPGARGGPGGPAGWLPRGAHPSGHSLRSPRATHPLLATPGAIEHRLVPGAALQDERLARGRVGGDGAGASLQGLLATLAEQDAARVDAADRGAAVYAASCRARGPGRGPETRPQALGRAVGSPGQGASGPGRRGCRDPGAAPGSSAQRTLLGGPHGTARALEPGRWAWAGLTRGSHGVSRSGSLWGCCTRSTCPRRPARLQAGGSQNPPVGPEAPTGSPAARACLTWPPQVPAPLGQRGAGPRVAVAPRAGCAVLPEGVLRARRLLPVTVLLQVTGVLQRTAQRAGGPHLAGQTKLSGSSRPPNTRACRFATGVPGPAPLRTSGHGRAGPRGPGACAHPALVAAGAVGALGPRGQPARRGVAAAVTAVLGGGSREGLGGLSAGPALGSRVDRPQGGRGRLPSPPISMAPCGPQGTGVV